ncbi:hypothetical protein DB30_06494 [Enhygromyxa salina]|uniref:Uncharacterized protein n=1 Tax=Enhygromyxa salina TaxID=215803 RepID=A0A0C2CY89_9BACT|nr:hypothetical protein DB30_06494 [Enhygromyxa salina]
MFVHRLADEVHGREVLEFQSEDEDCIDIGLEELVRTYQAVFDQVAASTCATLDAFIVEVEELGYYPEGRAPFSAEIATAQLAAAVAELGRVHGSGGYFLNKLSQFLDRHLPCCSVVHVSRSWGW